MPQVLYSRRMPVPAEYNDRDYQSHTETEAGEIARRVVVAEQITAQDDFINGGAAVGETEVQLSETSVPLRSGVRIVAALGNSGNVYVGHEGVTPGTTPATDGYELDAGEDIFVPVNDLNKVYLIGSAASQAVTYIAS